VQFVLFNDISKIYKSSGTNSQFSPAPPNMAKCSSFIAHAACAALGGGISPFGFILTQVLSLVLKM
jgi:hypothetical protein